MYSGSRGFMGLTPPGTGMVRREWWRSVDGAGDDRSTGRLVTDGGEDGDADDPERDDDEAPEGLDRATAEVTEAGDVEPADPKWEKPDLDDIPEFEVRADEPRTTQTGTDTPAAASEGDGSPTAGMPNTARSPGDSRIEREGTEGYIAALELCARLPEDVRLPEEAADLVPAAVEAELEDDVQSFAASEFDNPAPTVDVLEFVERDGDIWLRLRLGVPPDAFADLDPEAIRRHALEELEGLL